MPSRAASFGPWMFTVSPSKTISPLSNGWMPAMHLISVDLPAPLSPTSAMTSPLRTWKSTSNSAWTAPKLLETPTRSRTGVSSVTFVSPRSPSQRIRGRPVRDAPGDSLLKADLLALRRDVAGADVLHLREVGLADVLRDVVLGDRHRLEQDRRDVLGLVVDRVLDTGRLLALGERDRQLRGRVGLALDRLVDRHALVAVDDVLDALQRRVLARDRYLRVLALLERGDRRVRQAVVGGEHAVDLVAVLLQDLLEDRQRLLVVPIGHGLVIDLGPLTRVELRVDDGVVALLEQRRVVVRRRAVEHGDVGGRLVAHALDQALALQPADGLVVERDVVVDVGRVERQAVVVDHLDALRRRVRLDRRAGAGVEVDEQDHLRAVGDRLLGLLLLGGLVAFGVRDRGLDAGGVERLLQERPIDGLPAIRRLGVGQQHGHTADLAAALLGRSAAAAALLFVVAAAGDGQACR